MHGSTKTMYYSENIWDIFVLLFYFEQNHSCFENEHTHKHFVVNIMKSNWLKNRLGKDNKDLNLKIAMSFCPLICTNYQILVELSWQWWPQQVQNAYTSSTWQVDYSWIRLNSSFNCLSSLIAQFDWLLTMRESLIKSRKH